MARLPRLTVAGLPHLVLHRAAPDVELFEADDERRIYLAALAQAAHDSAVGVHAYVLLDDRVMLLVTPRTAEGLGRFMQRTGRRHVIGVNARRGRSGTLWDGRFRATVVDPDHDVLDCMCHVESQPVLQGMVAEAADWVWSSAAHHVGRQANPLLTDPLAYWRLGNTPFAREAAYRARLEVPLSAERSAQIDDAMTKGWALGSEAFRERLAIAATRRVAPLRRGRPRTDAVSVPKISSEV